MNPTKQENGTRAGNAAKTFGLGSTGPASVASLEVHAISRDTILGFLSDDEVASVSTSETAATLADGEEYLDLQALAEGVKRARGTATLAMGHVLPRKAVQKETWAKILAELRTEGAARTLPRP